MEYCSGGDLFSYLENRQFKISEHRAAVIIHKLCTAVYYLHEYGIVHRDLKPENIMMVDETEDSDIRLLDFGLSKMIGPNQTSVEPYGTLVILY
jgi:calcium-dependent protein kinase